MITSPTDSNMNPPLAATVTATSANTTELLHEIHQLKSQLKKVSADKHRLEQTFRSIQDRMRSDVESSLYIQAQGYEARLVELHSVIGELKRKMRHGHGHGHGRGMVIVEEEDENDGESGSVDTHHTEDDDDDGQSLEVEQRRGGRDELEPINQIVPTAKNPIPTGPSSADLTSFQAEINLIRTEHLSIRRELQEKEAQLTASKWTVGHLSREKSFLQDKISGLEKCLRLHGLGVGVNVESQQTCKMGMAKIIPLRLITDNPMTLTTDSDSQIKIPAKSPTSLTIPQRALSDSINLDAQLAEMGNNRNHNGQDNDRDRDRDLEYKLEIERLHYALENQIGQNQILLLNLDEGKDTAQNLTLLLGKYESRFLSMGLMLGFSSQLVESYDVLVALLESELGQLLANCRAVGIGSNDSCCSSGIGSSSSPTRESTSNDELLEVAMILQRANENREVAEAAARGLLGRVIDCGDGEGDGNGLVELFENPLGSPGTEEEEGDKLKGLDSSDCWDDTMSSTKSTRGSSSISNYSTSQSSTTPLNPTFTKSSSFDKLAESRVRSLIIQLKTRSESLRTTLPTTEDMDWNYQELPRSDRKPTSYDCIEARRNDLEIAILMQELMGLKEDRAELRGELFYLRKERARFVVTSDRFKLREAGYRAQISYLTEKIKLESPTTESSMSTSANDDNINNNNNSSVSDFQHILEPNQLIHTINQLNETLLNCEREHECQLSELETSNKSLLETVNSSKVKYEKRIRRMEEQIAGIVQRTVTQIRDYKEQIRCLQTQKQNNSILRK